MGLFDDLPLAAGTPRDAGEAQQRGAGLTPTRPTPPRMRSAGMFADLPRAPTTAFAPAVEGAEPRPVGAPGLLGGITEFGRGVARGVAVTAPEMLGKAAMFLDQPGGSDAVRQWGKGVVARTEDRIRRNPWLQESMVSIARKTEDAFALRGAAGEAGEMAVPSLGPAVAGGLLGAGIGAVLGGPPGAAVGAKIGASGGFLSSLVPFFGAQAQDTYERVHEAQTGMGKTPEEAHEIAYTAGLKTGGIEASGELVADLVTMRLFRLMPSRVKDKAIKAGTKGLRNPISMLKDLGIITATEIGTELGQTAAQAEIEAGVGVGEGATWEGVKGVIMPTAILSFLTFGGAETIGGMQRRQVGRLLANPDANPQLRLRAAQAVANEASRTDPELGPLFLRDALPRINARQQVIPEEDAYYRSLAQEQAARRPTPPPPAEAITPEAAPPTEPPRGPEAFAERPTPEPAAPPPTPPPAAPPTPEERGPFDEPTVAEEQLANEIVEARRAVGDADVRLMDLGEEAFDTDAGEQLQQTISGLAERQRQLENQAQTRFGYEGAQRVMRRANAIEETQETEAAAPAEPTVIDEEAAKAEGDTATEAQREAGTYKKGHVKIGGLDVSIENEAGSKRRPEWPTLQQHYGYVRGTEAKDGDQVDVFVQPGTEPDAVAAGPVFIVDQAKVDGTGFDEHKVMLGFETIEQAQEAYLSNYTPGWKGLRSITEVGFDEFKDWLNTGDTTKPFQRRVIKPVTKAPLPRPPEPPGPPGAVREPTPAEVPPEIPQQVIERPVAPAPTPGVKPQKKLKGDYGVKTINAYSDESEVAKKAFLKDARSYLNAVAKQLGWETRKPVASINEGGVAGSGEATLTVMKPGSEYGGYVQVSGDTQIPGVRASRSGVQILYRVNTRSAPYTGLQNNWGDWDMSAEDLAAELERLVAREESAAALPSPEERQAREEVEGRVFPSEVVAVPVPTPEPEVPTPAVTPTAERAKLDGAIELASSVQGALRGQESLKRPGDLFKRADKAFKGTQAQGAYTSKDAYDALEAGMNQLIRANPGMFAPTFEAAAAKPVVEDLRRLYDRVPTQAKRTEEQVAMQQFSTPHPHAYAMTWVANLQPQDVVLEPSAGTGNLAVHALNAGVREVHANELAEGRANLLEATLPDLTAVYRENATHLNAVLPQTVQPTVVLMNPPFSADPLRPGKRDLAVAATHIEQALDRLQPGGRLVALTGRGMGVYSPKFRAWFRQLHKDHSIRANVLISGKEYRKLGTTFDNRIIIIDKVPPAPDRPVIKTGEVSNVGELIDLLQEVRNARVPAREQPLVGTAVEEGAPRPAPEPERRAPLQPPAPEARPPAEPERPAPGAEARPARRPRRPREQPPEARPEVPAGERRRRRPVREEPKAVEERPSPRPGEVPPDTAISEAQGGLTPSPEREGEPRPTETDSLELAHAERPTEKRELTASVFEAYQPELKVKGAKPHPTPLSESAAMASVGIPPVAYRPNLPRDIIEAGNLSEIQLETIALAGHAHSQMLPGEEFRRGYFIGDGTGVGKGAQVAGIILDNWRQGRRKAVWISENQKLADDAARDLTWVGMKPKEVMAYQTRIKGPIKNDEAVVFTTYSTLASQSKPVKDEAGTVITPAVTRLDQLSDWLGKDFDGVIAFDEAHNLGNALDQKGTRGDKKASKKALAGVELQKRLPKARIVYVSATGATEVQNLAYADRLGLWGEGTAFATKTDFIQDIKAGGVAAMEVVARDMKQMGMYGARSLSYDGVTYDTLEHPLTAEQTESYDQMARAWQIILQNMNEVLEETGANKSGQATSAARGAFWGTHQRFFNQIITAMQMPSVIADVERKLEAGESAVLQLVNTNYALMERRMAQAAEADIPLEEVDLTPRDIAMQYLQRSFPVQKYERYLDDDGNERSRPVTDSKGDPVLDPAAVARRDSLIETMGGMAIPEGVLDQMLNHFGSDAVAEVTGRPRRLVRQPDGSVEEQKLGMAHNRADIRAFMDGKKRILMFTDAGATGASYHADLRAINQQKRNHYVVQPGWRADKVMQGFGRSHRTNQRQPPHVILVTTNLQGQKRFLSSVARRLDQLGALTKGSREAANQGMFSADMNLENEYGFAALQSFFTDLAANKIPELSLNEVEQQLGLKVTDEDGNLMQAFMNALTVPRFLNRLLSLEVSQMGLVFDAFYERLQAATEYARQEGTLDVGLETIRAESIVKDQDTVIREGEAGTGDTRYVKLSLTDPLPITQFEALPPKATFARNKKSGRMYALTPATSVTHAKTGTVERRQRRISPTGHDYIKETDRDKYDTVTGSELELRDAWETEIEQAPKTRTTTKHLITGALLPVWDRLPPGAARVYRTQTDKGERLIGREIKSTQVAGTLKAMGVGVELPKLSAKQWFDRVISQGETLVLSNGWQIQRRRVSGENRVEITGPFGGDISILKQQGAFTEVINWKTRIFVPIEGGGAVLERITASKPIVETYEGARVSARRVRDQVRGATPAQVTNWTRGMRMRWADGVGPRVDVASTFGALPKRLRDLAPDNLVAGVYDPQTQTVWLVADRIVDKRDAIRTLAHEAMGHHAMEQIVRDWPAVQERIEQLRQTDERVGKLYQDIESRYADETPLQKTKELLAVAAEQVAPVSALGRILQRVREGVRAFLGRVGLGAVWPANEVDQLIRSAARFLEQPATLEAVVAAPSFSRPPPPSPERPEQHVPFEDPDSEERFQASRKGIGDQRNIRQRLSDWLGHTWAGFTRHHIELPNTPAYAKAIELLRQFEAAPQASKEQAIRDLYDVTDGMRPDELELFTRKVVLDDLAWWSENAPEEAGPEVKLPWNLTPDTVGEARARVDEAIGNNEFLQARVALRLQKIRGMRDQLVEAGILHEEAKNPYYFRHQVLTYARIRQLAVGASRLKKPKPGWARRRLGSLEDISAHYLEAEFEYLQSAMVSLAAVKALRGVQEGYDIQPQLKQAARNANQASLQAIIDREEAASRARGETDPITGEGFSETREVLRGYRRKIAIGFKGVAEALTGDDPPDLPPEYDFLIDELRESAQIREAEVADEVPAKDRTPIGPTTDAGFSKYFGLMNYLLSNRLNGALGAATVFKGVGERNQFIQQRLGDNFKTWQDMVPEGYVFWQPQKGNVFYRGYVAGDDLVRRLLDIVEDEGVAGVSKDTLKEAVDKLRLTLVMGGKRPGYVIPDELASTLDNMSPDPEEGFFDHALATPLKWWKQWVLINPRRVIKYNLNNLSGDLDAVIAGAPGALKKLPEAIGELYRVQYRRQEPSQVYKDAVDRGVFDAGLTVQEIPDINLLDPFQNLLEQPKLTKQPVKFTASRFYDIWKALRDATRWRENWMRYAAYRYYLEQLQAGKTMRQIGYGAANPKLIDELMDGDKRDVAAALSRELVGDYGNVSWYGQGIRKKLIPFYSWMEINTKRYIWLFRNAWSQGIGATGRVGALVSAGLVARMFVLYGLINLWNHLFAGEEEDELSATDRVRLHLNLGRDEEGNIRLIRFQGAMSDFLQWFGAEDAVAAMVEMEKGRAGLEDIAKAVVKGAPNKIVSGLTPLIKTPMELAAGVSFFPDVFNPRSITDRQRELFRLWSLEHEYDLIMGRPSRGYMSSLEQTVTYKRDAGEIAYNRMKEMVIEYNRRERGLEGRPDFTSPRSQALRDYRIALRYRDYKASEEALAKLWELGATKDSVRRSIRRAHPLGALSQKWRRRFIATLTPKERETLTRAQIWYRDTYIRSKRKAGAPNG